MTHLATCQQLFRALLSTVKYSDTLSHECALAHHVCARLCSLTSSTLFTQLSVPVVSDPAQHARLTAAGKLTLMSGLDFMVLIYHHSFKFNQLLIRIRQITLHRINSRVSDLTEPFRARL